MPFKSGAQRKYFNWLASKGKLPKGIDLDEYNGAPKEMDAPESVQGYAYGGEVEHLDMDDYTDDHIFSPHDSSGEPNTNDEYEDEHPMEYMYKGGVAPMPMMRPKKMSEGGRVMFAHALKKRR